MKNTARWQLTSSALHGFMGAIQTAYGYSKDLNESLNNIRIVTQKNIEDMSKFADQANKAAKALSTTTTDYTDASLIYYQQGLSDEEVEARTRSTIKFANAARESAETASQELTAIWNNFADGSKELDYYADVLVKLGATTASSSQEISSGIQKFAAIGNTIGLSYEYAAAALATVTATTRESAEVVGTAFRTLFARLEGLKQGETLDDGTDLNKYSLALEKVGVSIKDTNGDLKDMDTILDELGARWNTLGRDQQMALAQTVAGVRQYAQLIALMDEWDFFQENVATARGSAGALDQQAAIYAESWEAARDRVRAAAEDIYDSVINPEFFIDVDNLLTPVLSGVGDFVDTIGGMQGVLALTASLVNRLFGDKIAQSISDMALNIGIMTGAEKERARSLQQSFITEVENLRLQDTASEYESTRLDILKQEVALHGEVNKVIDGYDEGQKQILENELALLDVLKNQVITTNERAEALQASVNNNLDTLSLSLRTDDTWEEELRAQIRDFNTRQRSRNKDNALIFVDIDKTDIDKTFNSIIRDIQGLAKKRASMQPLLDSFDRLKEVTEENKEHFQQLFESLGLLEEGEKASDLTTEDLNERLEKLKESSGNAGEQIRGLTTILQGLTDAPAGKVRELVAELIQLETQLKNKEISQDQYNQKIKEWTSNLADGAIPKTQSWSTELVAAGQSLSQLTMAFHAFQTLGEVFSGQVDDTEALTRSLMALSMILPFVSKLQKEYGEMNGFAGMQASLAALKNTVLGTSTTAVGAAAAGATPQVVTFGTALQTALGPIMWIISAVGLAVAAISSIANAAKQRSEAAAEAAKQAHEETQQELQDNQDLLTSYRQLYETYKETGEGKDTLAQKALELADKFGLEGAAVANLTGDYTKLNAQLRDTEKQLNAKALADNLNSKNAYGEAIVTAMRGGNGAQNVFTGNYSVSLGSTNNEQTAQADALRQSEFYQRFNRGSYKNSYNDTIYDSEGRATGYREIVSSENFNFGADGASPETLVEMYEAAEKAAEAMRQAQADSKESASSTYNLLIDWLHKSKDAYTEYKNLLSEIESGSFKDAIYSVEQGDISTYEEYLDYYYRLNQEVQKRVDKGEIEAENVEKLTKTYLAGENSLRRFVLQQELLNDFSEKFGNIRKDSIIEALDHLNDEQIATAISLIPQVSNAKEFETEFSRILLESVGNAALESVDMLGALVQELNKNSHISDKNYESLMGDTQFMEEITAMFGDFDNFRRQSEQAQIEYIRDYYTAVSEYAAENLQEQRDNAQEEYNITLQKYDRIKQLVGVSERDIAKLIEIQAEYSQAITYSEAMAARDRWEELRKHIETKTGVHIRFDITDALEPLDGLTTKLDQLEERLERITDQQIEIAVDWSDFDEIKGQFDSLAKFATIMKDANRQVGESYQYPIDAVRAWMDVYPELFAQASVTDSGLIELDKTVVENFIDGQKAEVDVNADAKIAQWELEKQNLEALRDSLTGQLEAYRNSEQGKIDISEMSKEEIAKLGKQLTDYQVDLGVDEVTAQKNALETMGLNQDEYSRIVAEVSQKNAKNVVDSTNEGAEKGTETLSKFSISWKNLAYNVGEVAKKIAAALQGQEYQASYKDVFSFNKTSSTYTAAGVTGDFKGAELDTTTVIEDFKADKIKQLELDLSGIENAIANIDAKILAARNLQETTPELGGGDPLKGKKGSGDTTPTKKELKDLKEIAERYHEITREIEFQNRELKNLDKQMERAYGTDRLDMFAQKTTRLTRIAELQGEKSKLARGFVDIDEAKLRDLGLDIKIDKDSLDITNYTKILTDVQDAYNEVYNGYNDWVKAFNEKTKAEQDELKSDKEDWDYKLDQAEKLYKKQTDALKSYEESVDTYRQQYDDMEDTLRAIEDNKLDELDYKFDVVLEFKDAKAELLDFDRTLAESFGDAITHGINSAAVGFKSAELEMSKLANYAERSADLQNALANAQNETDIARIKDSMLELQSNTLASAEALLDWIDEVENMVPDAVDAARERFDQFLDQLSHNSTVLSTIKELMALQGQTYKTQQGFANLQKVAKAQLDTAVANSTLNRKWFEEAQASLAKAQQDLEGVAENDVRYDYLKNTRDAFLAEFNEAQEAYLSSAQEAMEIAKEMYLTEIDQAIYEFGKALDEDGLDLASQRFDHYIETEGRYLDDVNKAYQQETWGRKIQLDYDKDTLNTHKALIKAFEDEYKALFNRSKVNEYDLEILEARYKVMQATIALQDAQGAKNNLRLVRDRQGNWNYQFTSDTEDVAKAEQDLADAQNDFYNIAKKQTEDITKDIVDLWQESSDAIGEIWKDESLTEEEKNARTAELNEYYTQKAKDLYDQRKQAYSDLVEAGKADLEDFNTKYGDTLLDMTGNVEDYEDALADLIDECKGDFTDYQGTINTVAKETHTDLDSMKKDVDDVKTSTDNLKTSGQEAADALWHTIGQIEETGDAYKDLFTDVHNVVEELRTLATLQTTTVGNMSGQTWSDLDDYSAAMAYIGTVEGTDSRAYRQLAAAREDKYIKEGGKEKGWKDNEAITASIGTPDKWFNDAYAFGEANLDNIKKWMQERGIQLTGFASGGYTGTFGTEGRLAFLHEKELVLNAEDTNNILAAVAMVRDIESVLNSEALAMQGQMMAKLGGYTPAFPRSTEDKQVTNYFDVSFPNATSSSEIEDALRNLANNADQWAERRDK